MDTPQPSTIEIKPVLAQPPTSDLYQRIQAFQIDDPASSYPFSAKLAHENDWSQNYTRRVIDEYRRFVYLTQVADHMICPSDPVDQAWHLHITYTVSYWDEFCSKVLGKPLHHHPSKGGSDEQTKFYDLYRQTLQTYQRVFGETPPSDIWHDPQIRFGKDLGSQRILMNRNWIVPKAPIQGLSLWGVVLAVLAMLILPAPLSSQMMEIISIGVSALAVIIAYTYYTNLTHAEQVEPLDKINLTPYEAAYLAGGAGRVVDTAIIRLVAQGSIAVSAGQPSTIDRLNPDIDLTEAYPLEIKIHQLVHYQGLANSYVGSLRSHTYGEIVKIERELKCLGLLLEDKQKSTLTFLFGTILLSTAGFLYLAGNIHNAPLSAFLSFGLGGLFLLWIYGGIAPSRTKEGDNLLAILKTKHSLQYHSPIIDWTNPFKPGGASRLSEINPYTVALLGTSVLTGTALSYLDDALKAPSRRKVNGGDGGGCGGCGGCGGDGSDGCGGDGCGGCGGE